MHKYHLTRKEITVLAMGAILVLLAAFPADAAVSNWHKAANMVPKSTEDFASASFKQSLKNLQGTGANEVAFVVPYYQADTGSIDVGPGWNTPSDTSLAAAIDYAHGLGMAVTLKMHVEPYNGAWRAYINPSDRDGWFRNYGNYLVHLAQIGQAHHAEMIVIGTELVSLTSPQMNSTNTEHWVDLISKVRAVYSGKLTYSANSNDNSDNQFTNEKRYVGFWQNLDYAALSTYYGFQGDNSVGNLKAAWDYWNQNDIRGFQSQVGKPVLIGEVGYRSVQGAHAAPWDWGKSGAYDATEQANDYEALFSYWNDYNYMQGVYLWNWDTNPSAGGSGDTSYTPQNKDAQGVMTRWFTNPQPPSQPQNGNPSFNTSATFTPSSPNIGDTISVTASLTNTSGSAVSGMIVDVEVYDRLNQKIRQDYYTSQQWNAGETRTFTSNWRADIAGTYRVTIGVFRYDWGQVYHWNNNAAEITIGSGSTGGGSSGGGNTGGGTSTSTPPQGNYVTEVWWPTDGASVTGVQPWKAMLQGLDVSQYAMYWQVDGGQRNLMYNSTQDYPHKEAMVDLSGWTWKGAGPYTITFVSTNSSGTVIGQRSVNIYVR